MIRSLIVACSVVVLSLVATPAQADELVLSGAYGDSLFQVWRHTVNGVATGINFQDAVHSAQLLGGHLAYLKTAELNNFVLGLGVLDSSVTVTHPNLPQHHWGPWFGAQLDEIPTEEVFRGPRFRWLDGSLVSSAVNGFNAFEPSGDPHSALHFLRVDGPYGDSWNDESRTSLNIDTYLVELPRPVPEPGTLALLGLGLSGLALRRRRAA